MVVGQEAAVMEAKGPSDEPAHWGIFVPMGRAGRYADPPTAAGVRHQAGPSQRRNAHMEVLPSTNRTNPSSRRRKPELRVAISRTYTTGGVARTG